MQVQTQIQTQALVESLVNQIDQLAVLDTEIKRLDAIAKE